MLAPLALPSRVAALLSSAAALGVAGSRRPVELRRLTPDQAERVLMVLAEDATS